MVQHCEEGGGNEDGAEVDNAVNAEKMEKGYRGSWDDGNEVRKTLFVHDACDDYMY